ncbi:hypothetical protein M8494_25300 [Serratia ureilytica]
MKSAWARRCGGHGVAALPLPERDGAAPQDDGIALEALSLAAAHGGWRLREIGGACAAGEMLAIVGPSGAGKQPAEPDGAHAGSDGGAGVLRRP